MVVVKTILCYTLPPQFLRLHPGRHREISFTCVQHDHNGIISRDINNMKAMTKPDLPGYPEVNYHPDDFPIVLLDD